MKRKQAKSNFTATGFFVATMTVLVCFSGCDENDPVREDTPELITRVTLTFAPTAGGDPVVVAAVDPDGEGVQNMTIDGPIQLKPGVEYILALSLVNELADPSDPRYDVTSEIASEADEHLFYYQWTAGLFVDPSGDGNVDNRTDPVRYEDEDVTGLPLGIVTSWTTGTAASGKFRILMKHQPGLKSENSPASVGETDLDIEFDLDIE